MLSRRGLLKLSAAASTVSAVSTLARPAIAQAGWPNRPVRILIPFTPGGGADTIARLVAIKMTEVLGQQFIVESKPGAGGNIAAEFTARSAPDGYTMFLAGDHHATNNHLNPNLTYDAVKDFEPVSLVVQYPVVLAVPGNSPSTTLGHFIERAKAEPGKLTYGSPGHGAIPHLSAELFVRRANVKMTNAPYRGAAPGIQDLIPGRIDSFWNNIAPMLSLHQDGKVRLLGVTTGQALADGAGPAAARRHLAGLRRDRLVCVVRAGQDAEGHHPEDGRCREGRGRRCHHPQAPGGPGHDRGVRHARRARALPQSRARQVGPADQGSRAEVGVGGGPPSSPPVPLIPGRGRKPANPESRAARTELVV